MKLNWRLLLAITGIAVLATVVLAMVALVFIEMKSECQRAYVIVETRAYTYDAVLFQVPK